jgi:primosomal protein N' (replication factor Y)
MTIARVALPVALDRSFDYWAPEGLALLRGGIVRVRLARRALVGVVVAVANESAVMREQLQPIDEVVSLPPLPDDVLALCEFVAGYYQQPLGMALALAVPPLGVRRALRMSGATEEPPASTLQTPLNDDQQAAVDVIRAAAGTFVAFLLQGVTGSGKTDVFLAAAETAIAQGGQVLLLVPEINLTPQLEARVRDALPRAQAVTLHSGLSDGERRAHWNAASTGDAQFVLGTRLAVFCALPRLALVIVDEEHDTSYKQQDGVRYHARDVAVWRARSRNVPIVLSSATPSLESFARTEADKYRRLLLPRRADPRAVLPRVSLVPNRGEGAHDGIAGPLWDALDACLARGEQALVFVNRRGYAPSLKCSACGWQADCPRCSARLTMHREPPCMQCHHCGHQAALPRSCPQCGNVDLLPQGHGTQRLERTLTQAFPHARIMRVDRDSTRTKGSFAAMRTKVAEQAIDLLVGTQMLAKGHDFPRLTLVGVLGADNALYSADFRATERLGALLTQVAGRSGRAGLPGAVIVQTDFPAHPVFVALETHDYDRFARNLLVERETAQLPPVTHAALLLAEAHHRADVDAFLDHAHAAAVALVDQDADAVTVYSPVPAVLARRAGFERGQLVVQSTSRASLQRFVARWRDELTAPPGKRVRVSLDIDPASFC